MNYSLQYNSFSFNLFNVIKLGFFVFLAPSIVLILAQASLMTFFFIGAATLLFVLIYIIQSSSSVSITNNSVVLENNYKSIQISNLVSIETWWSYEIGGSSIDFFSENEAGRSVPLSNKINCYVKFIGENEVAYIYEQIYLSEKFPNNHPYKHNAIVDKRRLIKVWDIDHCLARLNLTDRVARTV